MKIYKNTDYPTKSKDLKGIFEEFSVDVITCDKYGLLNIAYFNYDTEKWCFHADTLTDPYEGGELIDFVWIYSPLQSDKKTQELPLGFPTHSIDVNGEVIALGDIVDYDFEGDEPCPFEVVFENNAFRKKYEEWDNTLTKPLLEFGYEAEKMRLKIIKICNRCIDPNCCGNTNGCLLDEGYEPIH